MRSFQNMASIPIARYVTDHQKRQIYIRKGLKLLSPRRHRVSLLCRHRTLKNFSKPSRLERTGCVYIPNKEGRKGTWLLFSERFLGAQKCPA